MGREGSVEDRGRDAATPIRRCAPAACGAPPARVDRIGLLLP